MVGYIADLQKAVVEDVKNFFRVYYGPSNATIAIVGDFDPAQAKAWVTKYFGDLKRTAPDHATDDHAGHARLGETTDVRGPRAGAAAVPRLAERRR